MAVYKKISFELLLLLSSTAFLLTLVFTLQLFKQSFYCPDCESYVESVNLFITKLAVHEYRPIGLSFFYAIPVLFKDNFSLFSAVLFLTNFLIYILVVQLFFKQSLLFFSRKTSFNITLLLISLIGISINITVMLSELPFLFLMLLVFYFLTHYFNTFTIRYLHIAVFILLFSILVRPGIVFFVILVLLFFYKELLKSILSKSFILILLAVFLLAFQMISMKSKFGDYTFSYIGDVTYYNYLGSKAICFKENKVLNQSTNSRAAYIFSLDYANQKKVASQDFLSQVQFNTKNLVLAYIDDVEENTKTGSSNLLIVENKNKSVGFDLIVKIAQELSEWQNKLLTLFGLIFSIVLILVHKKVPKIILFFCTYFFYVFLISGISSTQGDRFHVLFYPFVLILIFYSLKHRNILFKATKQSDK